MRVTLIPETDLLKTMPANASSPSLAADISTFRAPHRSRKPEGETAKLAILPGDLLAAYKDADPAIKGAGEVYKYFKKQIGVEVGSGFDTGVQAGLLAWNTVGTAAELAKDEPDYVKVAIGGVKALADTAILLDSIGFKNFNPLFSHLISTGCSIYSRFRARDAEQNKAMWKKLAERSEPSVTAKDPKWNPDDPESIYLRADLDAEEIAKISPLLARRGLQSTYGLIGTAALGHSPLAPKGMPVWGTLGSSLNGLYLSDKKGWPSITPQATAEQRKKLRSSGKNSGKRHLGAGLLRQSLVDAAHAARPDLTSEPNQ